MRTCRHRTLTIVAALTAVLAVQGCSGVEDRLARHLERGAEFLAEGNQEKARVEFSNALQIDGANALAHLNLGRIAEESLKPRDAVKHYQAALDKDPSLLEPRAALGRMYLLAGLTDMAKEVVQPGLDAHPDAPSLRVVRGGWRSLEGDAAGALEDAEAAFRAMQGDEYATAFLASQYRRAGRSLDAINVVLTALESRPDSIDHRLILAELQSSNGNLEAAEEQLKEIIRLHPGEFVHRQRLVRFYTSNDQPARAEETLRLATRELPDSLDARKALVALIAGRQGVAAAREQMQAYVDAAPDETELVLALAQFHQQSGNPADAEAVYRNLISQHGTKAAGLRARVLLASMLVQDSRQEEAGELVAQVLAESPRDNDALVLRAGMAMARNQTSAAITDLRSVLRDQPDSVRLLRTLARAHLQERDLALAEEALRNATSIDPTDVETRLDLAMLLAQSGRAAQAEPLLVQAAKDDPTGMTVREALFRVQMESGRLDEAAATAAEMRQIRPDSPTGVLLAGAVLERTGKNAEAVRQYTAALSTASDPLPLLTALARHDLAAGAPQRAVGRLDAHLAASPKDQRAMNLRGEILLKQHLWPEAIRQFASAIQAGPKWWLPYRNKATAEGAAGQHADMLATLQAGIEQSDGSIDLSMDLASAQSAMRRHDDAITTYERALKHHPESPVLANNLAMLLVTHRRDEASLQRAGDVAKKLEGLDQAPYLDTLGWVRYHLGQAEESVGLLLRAVDMAPADAEIRFHLGMAQLKSGDKEAARRSLESALAANPAFAGAAEARAALEEIT